ncbi:cupredoxin domain-containing protein [Arboricoccus pini]|uniref:hypothetical protein n=1 Tax=Arboricoccus pini TaxID=1963835 RepID=UPI0013FD7994|nr:hypothetical protein [Arboricoccus pini]
MAATIVAVGCLTLADGISTAWAQAGLTVRGTNLAPLKLSAGKSFPSEPIELEAGKYYRWAVESDGSSEMAIAAPEFFRNIWINEVVINGIEVRPLGLDSIEFDDAGKATISFVPIRPGNFIYHMPNSKFEGKIIVK